MKKRGYKIPYSINMRRIDQPVTIPVIKRQFTILNLALLILLGGTGPMIFLQFSMVGNGSLLTKILFILGWELFVLQLIIPQSNGEPGSSWIIPVITYWVSKGDRTVKTRGNEYVPAVSDLLNIDWEIPIKNGVIPFLDDRVGYVYKFDGYASNMLFQSDQEIVIDAFETFMSNLQSNANLSVILLYAPLDVEIQIENGEQRTKQQSNAVLRNLADSRIRLLRDQVAKSFPVVTQTVLLTSSNLISLNEQAQWLEKQVQSGMARRVERLDTEDALKALSQLYRP